MYGKLQKKNETKSYYKDKMGKYQKQMQTGQSVKSRNDQYDEQCEGCTVLAGTNFAGALISSIFCYSFFLVSDLQS